MARWNHWVSDSYDFVLQTYFDRTERDWAWVGADRNTFDLDFQYRTQRFDRHDLIFGLGYRYTGDSLRNSSIVSLIPINRDDNLFSAFVQDDIELVPQWTFTLGSKFEHNDYTGFEIQPNARLLWIPSERQTLWASVARAVRTPGRVDHDASLVVGLIPPGSPENPTPVPQLLRDLENIKLRDLRRIGLRLQGVPRGAYSLYVTLGATPKAEP